MRAKSDIIEELSRNLTSDIWKKLKNSLLGRELIALGGEIISENENVKDTLLLQLNPDTADMSGLFMLAQMNEVPITSRKPASIVVITEQSSKTYAPFELHHNIGNQAFYNIEYTLPNKTVSLWHGTFKYYLKGNAPADSVDLENGTQVTNVSNPSIYDGGELYEYINIGNAYPDSIIVKNIDGTEIQRYSSDNALSDNVGLVYKVFTQQDGTQCIRFMNGDTPADFKIEWLDHSAGTVDYDDNVEVKINNVHVATIQYASEGAEDDLDFMRRQLKKEMVKYDGLNTPKSVESYANSMPYIIDSKCAFDEKGRICVYVKPAEDVDLGVYLDYSELAAHISLNSLLFPSIKVMTGKRLLFGMTISGIAEQAIREYTRNVIQQKYAYDKMGFSSAVNTSEIVADVYGKYGIAPSITMTIRENFTIDEQLSYVPEKNSIKGFDVDGTTTLTEINGVLYSTLKTYDIMNLFDVVCCVGNMVLLKKYRDYKKSTGYSVETNYKYLIESEYSASNVDANYTLSPTSSNSYDYTRLDDFYLWDASSNTIKPFDDNIEILLAKAKNGWFTDGKDAWVKTGQTLYIKDLSDPTHYGTVVCGDGDCNGLLSLQDVQVLSTNNNVVFNFILNTNGTDKGLDDGGTTGAGTLQNELYNFYKRIKDTSTQTMIESTAYGLEHKEEYKGHYQVSICVSNNIFRNILSESWGEVKDIFYGLDGNPNVDEEGVFGIKGFYDGFKGYQLNGNTYTDLNIKANSFYFEGVMYYPKSITSTHVEIANNVSEVLLTISINSAFKGMVEQDGVLYVIQRNNITMIEGFSGIKQRSKIYTTYKGNNLFAIEDMVVGMNGTIMIKSTDGFYVTRKIVVRDSVSITFEDLNKLFVDSTGADYVFKGKDNATISLSELTIGSCTAEYATCYKKNRNKPQTPQSGDTPTTTAESTLNFYCYDIKNKTTQEYHCYNSTAGWRKAESGGDYEGFEEITSTDTNMGGTIQEIGVMDYETSMIEVNGSADLSSIATIQYNGITSNNKVDSYIVLNESDIKFI